MKAGLSGDQPSARPPASPEASPQPSLELQSIAQRLAAASGIEPGSLDPGRMQWVVEARCRDLRLVNAAAYADYLEATPQELEALIDALLIQETRFFRDPAVFEHIRRWAPQMASTFPGLLRILSAPCSTGQEAYSTAAILHDAGLPLAGLAVDAFDISLKALATARRAVYPEAAVQNIPASLRAACGVVRDQHFHVHDNLRRRVHFERRNLAEPEALGSGPTYHLILCRNLFIYLQPTARASLARSLADTLVQGGRLVLGTADRCPELDAFFSPLDSAAAFAFGHTRAPDPSLSLVSRPDRSSSSARHAKPAFVAPNKPAIAGPDRPAFAPLKAAAAEFYRRALEHHNYGNLRQAERRCRQALYILPGYLPALELLQTIWRAHPKLRLRNALQARIQRTRTLTGGSESSSAVDEDSAGDEKEPA